MLLIQSLLDRDFTTFNEYIPTLKFPFLCVVPGVHLRAALPAVAAGDGVRH